MVYIHFRILAILRSSSFLQNKDDNIHESKALKRQDKQTLTLVEY